MNGFSKYKINPVEYLKKHFDLELPHITFDPSLTRFNCQYQIIRQQSTDGTTSLTHKMVCEILHLIANEESVYKPLQPEQGKTPTGIKYIVGNLQIVAAYGIVQLRAGKYPGESQRYRLPIISEFTND